MTSYPDNNGNLIYDTLENIKDASALNEKEETRNLKTIYQATSNGRTRGVNRKKRRNRKPKRRLTANRKTTCAKKGKRVQTKKTYCLDFSRPTLDVCCGKATGVLFKEKMKKGVHEKCIEAPNGQWYSLLEFEAFGGRKSWKNWKRSIYCYGKPLEELIMKGKLPRLPHHRKGKRKVPVHQAPQFQSSGVICIDSLEQATSSTPYWSPSEDADIQSQQSPGFKNVMVAAEGPQEPAMASETTASQSVDSLFSDSVPASCAPAATSASNQRIDIPSSLHRTANKFLNTSLDYRTMRMTLKDIRNQLNDLKQALDMSGVMEQMNDIYQQTRPLETSVKEILKTLGLEKPQL